MDRRLRKDMPFLRSLMLSGRALGVESWLGRSMLSGVGLSGLPALSRRCAMVGSVLLFVRRYICWGRLVGAVCITMTEYELC